MRNKSYVTFVAAKGESVQGLDKTTRERFEALGLIGLSDLSEGGSYIGIVDGLKVVAEKVEADGSAISIKGAYEDGAVNIHSTKMHPRATLNDAMEISSKGSGEGSAEISIAGSNRAEGNDGLNFVAFNRESGRLLDTSSFDTHSDLSRSSDLPGSK